MKRICATAVLALFCGCGGGGGGGSGGGGGGGGGGGNPGPGIPEQIAQQILELCGVDATDDLQDLFDALNGLLNPLAPLPNIQFMNVDVPGGVAEFSLDFDNDSVPDIFGFLRFQDNAGAPFIPDLSPLLGGSAGIEQVLMGLPDGTEFVVEFNGADPTQQTAGNIVAEFTGGALSDLSGQVTIITPPDCQVVFTFAGLTLGSISGAFPDGVVDATFVAAAGMLEGTITFDGTNVALVEVTLDGGAATLSLFIDLTTGVVTPVP